MIYAGSEILVFHLMGPEKSLQIHEYSHLQYAKRAWVIEYRAYFG